MFTCRLLNLALIVDIYRWRDIPVRLTRNAGDLARNLLLGVVEHCPNLGYSHSVDDRIDQGFGEDEERRQEAENVDDRVVAVLEAVRTAVAGEHEKHAGGEPAEKEGAPQQQGGFERALVALHQTHLATGVGRLAKRGRLLAPQL